MTPTQWLEYARNCFDQLHRKDEAGGPKFDVRGATRHDIAKHLAVVSPL